ncbi:MAG: hypothetical protein A3K67_02765 [Euryarchaeota archaeon RBG_16_62_10]|nr:MAG: hypothetical protein A3K67_02765 [Euryarchaeota archaeon RBG_16_62_10]
MRAFQLARYSMLSALRNRERTLFAILGAALAVSFVSGNLIAIDSTANSLLSRMYDSVPVDFWGERWNTADSSEESLAEEVDALSSVDNVDFVLAISKVVEFRLSNRSDVPWDERLSTDILFLPSDSTRFMESFRITGDVPAPGTAAISEKTARDLGIGIGGTVYSSMTYYNGTWENDTFVGDISYVNLSFEVSSIWTQAEMPQRPYSIYDPYEYPSPPKAHDPAHIDFPDVPFSDDPLFLRAADSESVIGPLKAVDASWASHGRIDFLWNYFLVWADRSEIVVLADSQRTMENIDEVISRLGNAGFVYGVFFNSSFPIVEQVEHATAVLDESKPILVGLSFPVLALGTYISLVGANLGMRGRRREIGTVKARGAGDRTVLGLLAVESIILGALAGALGILGGLFVGYIFADISAGYLIGEPVGGYSVLGSALTAQTVVLGAVFGVMIMAISDYGPIRRVSRLRLVEAMRRESAVMAKARYDPRIDAAILSVSLFCVVTVLALHGEMRYRGSYVVSSILDSLSLFASLVIPVVPLLLSFSLVRLLTLGTRRLYPKLASMSRPFTKELHDVVRSSISRNPRRVANTCIIISLALAFGLFITVTMESTVAYKMELVRGDVGADIRVRGYSPFLGEEPRMTLGSLDELENAEGVESVCGFQWDVLGEYSLSAFDAESYLEVVRPSDFWFLDTEQDAVDELRRDGTALVRLDAAGYFSILVGDDIRLTYVYHDQANDTQVVYESSVEIIGVVRDMPGLLGASLFVDFGTMAFIPSWMLAQTAEAGALIDVVEDADPVAVAVQVEQLLEQAGYHSYVTDVMVLAMEEVKFDPSYGALMSYLRAEYGITILMMSLGVGLITVISVADREQELACMVARGMRKSQMRRLLVGEHFPVLLFGIAVGVLVGLLSAHVFNLLVGEGIYVDAERKTVISDTTALTLLLTIGLVLFAGYLACYRAGRLRLAENLRVRGG